MCVEIYKEFYEKKLKRRLRSYWFMLFFIFYISPVFGIWGSFDGYYICDFCMWFKRFWLIYFMVVSVILYLVYVGFDEYTYAPYVSMFCLFTRKIWKTIHDQF